MRAAIFVAVVITVVRAAFVWVAGYDLVGDEAHYWDWSRHLDWSYYSKGPGVAWSIWAFTSLLGHTEFAVRLPTVLASGGTLLLVAWLARALYPGSKRAPLYAVVALAGVPIVHGVALLMTIDGPYVACWAWALCAAWLIAVRARRGDGGRGVWLLGAQLGVAMGVGFLFKYTILLLVPSLVLFVLLSQRYRERRVDRERAELGVWFSAGIAALVGFVVCSLPVVWWNVANGSPTVKHLMGHLGMRGGDMPVEPKTAGGDAWSPLVTLEYFGTQIGMIGPMLVVAVVSSAFAVRRLLRQPHHPRCVADLFLLCTGWTIFVVYWGVSFRTNVEGNWPVAGVVSLMTLVGRDAARVLPDHARRVRAWLASPEPRMKRGIFRKKPETGFQIGYHWGVAYGAGALVLYLALPIAARLPVLGEVVPLSRIEGASERAGVVQGHLDALRGRGEDPIVIATEYWLASHLAFYLDGQPLVYSGTSFRGGRKSSYDFFGATDLTDASLVGRPAVLVSTHKNESELERARWLSSRLGVGGLELLEAGGRAADRPTVFYVESFGGVVDAAGE